MPASIPLNSDSSVSAGIGSGNDKGCCRPPRVFRSAESSDKSHQRHISRVQWLSRVHLWAAAAAKLPWAVRGHMEPELRRGTTRGYGHFTWRTTADCARPQLATSGVSPPHRKCCVPQAQLRPHRANETATEVIGISREPQSC